MTDAGTAVRLAGVRLDAQDPVRVADYWAALLRGQVAVRADGARVVVPDDEGSVPLVVVRTDAAKTLQNRIHLDLATSSAGEREQLVARALALGGTTADVGQSPDEPHTVLADPEGNELCVIDPGNEFLAGTGTVGAVNCDGTRAVGLFWSAALGWALVWDQDEETAIQSPRGGSKITWSGPPLMPRGARDRLRLEVSATAPLTTAIGELTALGARTVRVDEGEAVLRDPDENEFHLC